MRKLALLAAASLGLASTATAAILTVTSTADSGPGTLHQALLDSNASVGVLDTIAFAIPGAGVHTIVVSTDLPTATDPVIIDGTTQPGYAGSPLIELTESAITQGFRISAGNSTVRGLAIFEFGVQLTLISNGGNLVEACYIGINATATVTSSGLGLQVQNSPDTTIGGTDSGAGNVISGNTGNGIQVVTSDRMIIRGNLIGTDPTGTQARNNGGGISIVNSDETIIGGTVAGMGNLVSNSDGNGIHVTGSANVLIAGNLIGTDVTGTQAMPNNFGLDISNLPDTITIGTPDPAGRNVISGNNQGLFLNNGVHGATIQNNYVGTDITGTLPLPNNNAILLNTQDTTDVLIGGPNAGEGNLIVFNEGLVGSYGIWSFGKRITVRGNKIFANEGLGWDIDPQGVNPNDLNDADTGANDGQNFPIVTSVEVLSVGEGIGTRVIGVLRSEASTQYILDFYGNDGCTARPQDFLEGQTYLGFGQVTTDGSGVGNFDVTLSTEIALGDFVSATATDPEGNTSEFSQRLPFSVFPVSGDPAGGTAITIQGTDFASGATVTLGGVAASNVVVGSSTQITAQTPALPAGTVNDLTVTNLDGTTGTLPKAFVSDFLDVPSFSGFHVYVTTLVRNAITAGVGGGMYGVTQPTLRQQMAVFLLKAKYGVCYVPPPCQGDFPDVPCPSIFAAWIEDLADQGITGGCGNGNYCPQNPVRRDQMAAFLLRTKYGSAYVPPPCDGDFDDVACPSLFADWIEQLAEEQITTGCGGPNYCPLNPNTRGQMAVFLTKTFNLQ
jgi:hypothetical protein